jgi:hypothetical protein
MRKSAQWIQNPSASFRQTVDVYLATSTCIYPVAIYEWGIRPQAAGAKPFPFSTECVCRTNSCVEADQDSETFSCTIYYILHCLVCYITFWGIRDTFDQETTTTLAYSNTAYSHRPLRSFGYRFSISRVFAFARRRLLGARLLLFIGRVVQGKVNDFAFDDILGRARQ